MVRPKRKRICVKPQLTSMAANYKVAAILFLTIGLRIFWAKLGNIIKRLFKLHGGEKMT
ncbi:hypothetical protein JOD02_000297 [Caldicoprobacter guelmensis]|nr:hypothetical protein [Caldicoprobacter guelmensis]